MAGYGSDVGFAAYAAENGYTVPSGTVAAARQRGSAYIDAAYAGRFPGEPSGGIDQERAWPRDDAEDIYGNVVSGIPTRVINASYEATLLELTSPGSLTILAAESERVRRLKAGSVEIEYAEGSAYTTIEGAIPMSSAIEGLLYPLITGTRMELPAILVT
jgi:hypothetical protein